MLKSNQFSTPTITMAVGEHSLKEAFKDWRRYVL